MAPSADRGGGGLIGDDTVPGGGMTFTSCGSEIRPDQRRLMRDISELDGIAEEIRVCLEKHDNYRDSARHKVAPAIATL